ncbi:MAG: PH domain-containing protein [Propionibacteriaceae bacterium]|jgi:membrane protein YdbS with pleckstrin-like domain|nr:PH domain-containing protein [Propionibacteriaceae bacterium]
MGERPSLLRPDVERYLLVDEGETVIDEVVKHPVTLVGPVAAVTAGAALIVVGPALGGLWLPAALAGLVLAVLGLHRYHYRFMDRFVITNMRVFRVHGIFSRRVATMPLARILDISVHQPGLGMLLDYGHFTFETAALEQGLHTITHVGDPRRRDLTIQRVIQRAGIRAMAPAGDPGDDGT